MVVHRPQGAGNLEQSSQRCTLLKGITSRIALPLLLLASLSFIPAILCNALSSVICIIHAPQNDRVSRRNQYISIFNIHNPKKSLIATAIVIETIARPSPIDTSQNLLSLGLFNHAKTTESQFRAEGLPVKTPWRQNGPSRGR
jgi:hypothetical protein